LVPIRYYRFVDQQGEMDGVFFSNVSNAFRTTDNFHPVLAARKRYTIFHKFFFNSLETACANPNLDAEMRRHHVAATAVLVAITTIMLSACGPDDGASASADQSSAAPNSATSAATLSARETSPALTPPAAFAASATLTNVPSKTGPNAAPGTAPEDAVQSVEASLAADSQQVTPVLHYAPGDSDQSGKSN
jgi:hypothetical protein